MEICGCFIASKGIWNSYLGSVKSWWLANSMTYNIGFTNQSISFTVLSNHSHSLFFSSAQTIYFSLFSLLRVRHCMNIWLVQFFAEPLNGTIFMNISHIHHTFKKFAQCVCIVKYAPAYFIGYQIIYFKAHTTYSFSFPRLTIMPSVFDIDTL